MELSLFCIHLKFILRSTMMTFDTKPQNSYLIISQMSHGWNQRDFNIQHFSSDPRLSHLAHSFAHLRCPFQASISSVLSASSSRGPSDPVYDSPFCVF